MVPVHLHWLEFRCSIGQSTKAKLVIDANKFGGNIDIGALGTAVVSQPTNGTLAGVLSGTGTILKNGEGTLFLIGDSSAFGGVVKISSGAINTGTADAKGRSAAA
ncbi:hypothetical protein HED50_20245 [Ochrobactrum oryzae]|nr:hypothetical protein [Brucella oryzae]